MGIVLEYDDGYDGVGRQTGMRKVIADWTSDAAGNATATTRKLVGRLVKAITAPAGGGAAPTDNYDITLTDPQGIDLLASCQIDLQNRDTIEAEEAYFLLLDADSEPIGVGAHPVVCEPISISVAAAGNAKSGRLVLYFQA